MPNAVRYPFKVRAVSTSDLDGGAARAAFRLQKGLLAAGVDSEFWVQRRTTLSPCVHSSKLIFARQIGRLYTYLDALPKMFYHRRQRGAWSTGFLPNPLLPLQALRSADLVHFHGVTEGFVPLASVSSIGRPIVWTLHDMAALTGGCHYAGECLGFTKRCGGCPQLGSSREKDLTRLSIWLKERYWAKADIDLVCPSHWLAERARLSPLFYDSTISVIPNGLDLATYKPMERNLARSLLRLPQEPFFLMTAAMNVTRDRRKGFQHLERALSEIGERASESPLELLVVGDQKIDVGRIGEIPIRYLGRIDDEESMAQVYSAADLFIAPSEQDNLPNTVMEAMACGTPCIAFDIGGMSDLIDDQQNGRLIKPFSTVELANSINELCADRERVLILGDAAVEKVHKYFDVNLVAEKYAHLFEDVLERFRKIGE